MVFQNQTSEKYTHVINCSNTYHYVPVYGHYISSLYVAIGLLGAQIIPTVILNVLAAYILCTTKSLRSSSNVLLTATSLCDIASALFGTPAYMGVYWMGLLKKHNCGLYIFAVFWSHSAIFLAYLLVCLMAFDRYLAIFKPYFYSQHINGNLQVYIRTVVALTIFVFAICGLSFLTVNRLLVEAVAWASFPLIFVCIYIHIKVYFHVTRVRRKISAEKCRTNHLSPQRKSIAVVSAHQLESSVMGRMSTIENISNNEKPRAKLRKQVNLSYLTILVLISLCVCFIPYFMIVFAQKVLHMRYNPHVQLGYMWSYCIMCFKSLINPLIYCYRSKALRDKTVGILKQSGSY